MPVIQIFKAGGPIMYLLALCSLISLAIIVERLINLRAARVLDPGTVQRVLGLAEAGRVDRAIDACRGRPGMFSNIVLAGLELAHRGESIAKEAVEDAGRHESARLNRFLGTLGTVAGVAPLLGLLGTVLGMIDVFKKIAEVGVGQAGQLSSGISQALITTATGLLVAIPALVSHNYFQEKAEMLVADLERESLRVLRSVYATSEASSAGPPVREATAAAAGE